MEKKAYISSPEGELNITIIRAERPEVTLMLDLGIPNFTVFALRIPLIESMPQGMQEMVTEGVKALLDEVSTFMVSLNYDQDVIVLLYATVLQAYKDMTNEADTMSQFSDVSRDPIIKTYEGTFKLPMDFINETQQRVVTASKVLQRLPKMRRLELVHNAPEKADLGDVARVIRQYRNRSLRNQPKPLYVVVYDSAGRPSGTLPLGNNFKNKLLQMMKSSRSVTSPEFTEAIQAEDDLDLRLTNTIGIPKQIMIGDVVYFPEGVAGDDMALYACASKDVVEGTWVVKFPDGRMVRFVDRPSIEALRSKNYAIPARHYWSLMRNEDEPLSNEAEEAMYALNTGGDPN